MTKNIFFIMPPQGTSGPVPLDFLLLRYPVIARFYEQTKNYFLQIGYSKEEILHNFSSPSENTAITSHPFIYFWSVSLATMYMKSGIAPNVIIGHSLGEFAALTVASYTNYLDMLHFVTQRALLIDKTSQKSAKKGAMCHIALPVDEIKSIITPLKNLSIASINSKNSCVISGLYKEIVSLEKICDSQQILHKRLRVPHAAHSPLLRDINFTSLPFPKITKIEKPNFSVILSSGITIEQLNSKTYPNNQAKTVADFYSTFSSIQQNYKNQICVEFSVHSTLKSACLANGALEHFGASALETYIPNLSREECFYQAIENNLAKLRRLA